MSNLNSIVLSLAIGYALLGVLLLVACLFTPLPWPVKAGAIIVTSAFYLVSFFATHSLLGWSTDDPLPPNFKLLGARIVEPHSVEVIPARSISGSRLVTMTISPAAFREPIGYPIPPNSRTRPKPPLGPAPTAIPREDAPRILAQARVDRPNRGNAGSHLVTGGGDPAGGGDELDTSATHGQGLVSRPCSRHVCRRRRSSGNIARNGGTPRTSGACRSRER